MGSDNAFHRIKRAHTFPMYMKNAHVLYTVTWQKEDSIILPVHMTGKSEFLGASKHFSSKTGEGIVGWMYDKRAIVDAVVLHDMLSVDPRLFLRKGAALLSNVWSILFLNQRDGLLELGFEQPHAAREALSCLVLKTEGELPEQDWLTELAVDGLPKLGLELPHAAREAVSCWVLKTVDKLPEYDFFMELAVPAPMAMDLASDISLCHSAASSPNHECLQPLSPGQPLEEPLPSAGSTGHPHYCSLPCKYVWKKSGCKDGNKCTRCHLCRFVPDDRRRTRRRGACKHSQELPKPEICRE